MRSAVGQELSYRPVTAAGGVGALHYAVSPPLPAGLKLDEATGMLTGAAAALAPLATYTVTVTDSDSPARTAMANFIMEIDEMLLATCRVDVIYVMAEDPVTVAAPVNASGGVGTRHFEISPALPAGLALDAGDGGISGSAVGESAETVYTVTVHDSLAQRAGATFSLRVFPTLKTSVLNASETHRVNDTVSYTPATTWGGARPYHYTVSPPLPDGLAMDPATGLISGTSTVERITPPGYYTVTITDGASPAHTVQRYFGLVLFERPGATVLERTKAYMIGDTVNYKPVQGGGAGGRALRYHILHGGLPAGLTMDPHTGVVSGTALEVSPSNTFAVAVSDPFIGGLPFPAYFDLEIAPALGLIVTSEAVTGPAAGGPDVTLDSFLTAVGGVGDVSITGTEPASLVFSKNGTTSRASWNLVIKPDPATTGRTETITMIVTDAAGHTATKAFAVTWP